MRTTINLADNLLEQVILETKTKTITQAIRSALEEYLEHRERIRLIKSFGSFKRWNPDIQAMRQNRDLG